MLQARKRYPLIEPVQSQRSGFSIGRLEIHVSDNMSVEKLLFKLYRGLFRTLNDDEQGYPVCLYCLHWDLEDPEEPQMDDEEEMYLRLRFVPYRETCQRLYQVYKHLKRENIWLYFEFYDLNDHKLWVKNRADDNEPSNHADYLDTAKWCKECSAFISSKSDREICWVCNPDAPTITSLFASQLERRFYYALMKLYPNLQVFPKIGLKDIFDSEFMRKHLDSPQFEYFLKAHIDYLVVGPANHRPTMAFEIDGPHHQLDVKQQQKRDKRKNYICSLGKLPLYRIPFEDLDSDITEDQVMARISDTLKNI